MHEKIKYALGEELVSVLVKRCKIETYIDKTETNVIVQLELLLRRE